MRSLDRYLNELIDEGGLPATRAEVILEMQRARHPQPINDRWLQGQQFAASPAARRPDCCQAPNLLHHSSNC